MDYLKESEATASGVFNPHDVGAHELVRCLENVVFYSKQMDQFKKVMFRKRSRIEAGLHDLANCTESLCLAVPDIQDYDQLIHGIVGNITEVGEQAEILIDLINNHGVDKVNVKEEIGDNLWYLACQLRWVGSTFDEEMARNIAKLRTRHGNAGFSKEGDMNRDLHEERDVLEGPSGKPL